MNDSDGAVLVRSRLSHARRQPPDLASAPQSKSNRAPGRLEFSRTDIVFSFEATEIDIALRVRNAGKSQSKREVGRIEAAPFGAFLPWTPLTRFELPLLEPGAAHVLRLRVPRPALGGDDPPRGDPPNVRGRVDSPRSPKRRIERIASRVEGMRALLDQMHKVFPWLARKQLPLHHAGNLNVHVGNLSVERHCCGPQLLVAGARNVAAFFVGEDTDAYRFNVSQAPPGWNVNLKLAYLHGQDVVYGRWYDGAVVGIVQLRVVGVLLDATPDPLEVQVEQRSTGRVATVEFAFARR
jgi:hypothetical protein